MADKTAIEWTNSTWNPVTGCTKISPGCDRCYAERFAERFRGVSGHPFENGFDLTLRPERLAQPLSWQKSRMIFVNSMSDLFHKDVPLTFVEQVFETMERAHWHVFQVLTKRSSRLRNFVNARYSKKKSPEHIWLGVSIEDGQRLSRLKHIQDTSASVRFLSIEPLIGQIGQVDLSGIHWVIAGGESGPGARPLDPMWVREIRDQCIAAKVPFFFKQWGGLRPKSGGRRLDGREWSEWPHSPSKRAARINASYELAAE
jgi:protein gp37